MKNLLLTIALMLAMWQAIQAQPVPQNDNDTVWTKLLWNLGSDIHKVQFTPDGNSIAVAIGDGVYVYDIFTSNLVKEFKGYGIVSMIDFIFTPDGTKLITSSIIGNIIVWDYDKIDTLVSYHSTTLSHMEFINENQILGSTGIEFKILDLLTGNVVKSNKTNGDIYAFAISLHNNVFAVGAIKPYPPEFYNVELWDLNAFNKIQLLGAHNNVIRGLDFSSDGKYLASASEDGTAKVWDVENKKLYHTFIHDSGTTSFLQATFSPMGNFLVTSGGGGFTTKIWDIKTFNLTYQYNPPFGATYGLDVSKDSSFISVGLGYRLYILKAHWTPTGIKDSLLNTIKNLYPNPSGNEITIPLIPTLKASSINFCDYSGRLIKNVDQIQPYINQINVDISNLHVGIYMANVLYPEKTISYKFEKSR